VTPATKLTMACITLSLGIMACGMRSGDKLDASDEACRKFLLDSFATTGKAVHPT